MANEASIIDNPTSTPAAVSTGYQRQNTRAVAASNGIDRTVVEAGSGNVTVKISGPIDVNGVLYSITSSVTLTITGGADRYIVYLAPGSGDYLTPTLDNDLGTFDDSKNARYTSGGYRILNWLIYYDGTTVFVSKWLTPKWENNHLNDIDESEEEWITSSGTWTARKSKYYTIWMTGKGGNSNTASTNEAASGGGAGLTGLKRIYIEAGTTWTATFSTTSGGDLTFTDGVTTLAVQNGYNGSASTAALAVGGAGGTSSSGMDITFPGGDAGAGFYLTTSMPRTLSGGKSFYGGNDHRANSSNGVDGNVYGAGATGAISTGTGASGASGVIRIIG